MSFYQVSLAGSQATVAAFVGWAGNSGSAGSSGIAYALNQLGFTLVSDTYTAQWAGYLTGTNNAVLGTEAVISSLNGSAFPSVASAARTQLLGTNFLGAYAGGTTYSRGNVVTYTAVGSTIPGVYIFINASPTAGQAPTTYSAPTTTLNSTYWQPYSMEIWQFKTGPNSLTPFYMKLEYGYSTTAVTDPQLFIQLGTGYVTNSGVLSGNVSLCEQIFNGSGTIAATECDFAGDGINYLAIHMFRGGAANPGPAIWAVERSISGTAAGAPVYNSSYFSYVKGFSAAGNWYQQTVFMSGSPTTATRVNYANTMTLGAATATLIVNNTTPAFPVWPMLGYCGNPMTVLIAQQEADTTEGATQACTVYGSTLNYIMSKVTYCLAFGGSGQTASYGVGIRAS